MIVNLGQNLEKKEIRKLKCLWGKLGKKRQYFLPKTIEDLAPKAEIKIDGVIHFFTDDLKESFREFIKTIYYHSTIAEYFCYNTIYQSAISELQRSINNGDTKNPIEFHLTAISDSLNKKLAKREFYFLLSGLRLKGVEYLRLDDVLVFDFEESHLSKIIENKTRTSEDDDFDKDISEFVKKNFFGETCIKVSCLGDCEKAEQTARSKARLVLNYFRFLFCVVHYERVCENRIKISIKSESFQHGDLFFLQSEPKGSVTLSSGIGRRNLQDFELNEHFLKECKETIFFDDFFDFAFKKDKTEIENIITTAIYWIGEAQEDFDTESSFLKYWIAIESIFTLKKEGITEALCKGVSVVLTFSPYGFIEVGTTKSTYNRISKLYDLRSKIVHRGSYQEIKDDELIEMCKLSWQTVLSFFHLRNIGYQEIAQVDAQINHLFRESGETSKLPN